MARAASCLPSELILLIALLPCLACAASSEEEMFFKGVADVNNGNLHFLSQAPATPIHHHQNQITLNTESLATGWAKLEQCHDHLDPVPDAQIVYGQDRIRNLAIARSAKIGRAWVENNTVQMQQVEPNALICITAETRALAHEGENRYSLSNGPYMRRFLDGFYPMQVSMRVRMDAPGLQFLDISPAPQTGFSVTHNGNEVAYDALFEGVLRTAIRFTVVPH
jgi:hypothetical protein